MSRRKYALGGYKKGLLINTVKGYFPAEIYTKKKKAFLTLFRQGRLIPLKNGLKK